MDEREQLEQAIAALEAQRAILGDVAVEAAVAGLRLKLAALAAPQPSPAAEQRKQVTVLFADVSGFTAMSETLDAEQVRDTMNALWLRLDRAITSHGGRIDKHIGDAVMALWGVERAGEDDAERAIRAALAMQAELGEFAQTQGHALRMRIGINTGPVLLGAVGTTSEFTAMGDAVNLASRLEHAAPVGGILISHDTYRHVRGVFDVTAQPPLSVKGKAEPVQTYVVQRAKPRAFRVTTRGIEGIETRMVGREAELAALQDAFRAAVQCAQTRLVTVVGDAGVGKSRLLYEFDNWVEVQPERALRLRGRSTPEMSHSPYSLIRDVFCFHCDILDSDSAAAAREKFVAGVGGYLDADQAHLAGHLVGFDFSSTRAVQGLAGSPAFAPQALAYLMAYFRRAAAEQPVVFFLEDIHWADNASLDLVERLAGELAGQRVLIVCLTRPALYERRPNWAQSPACARLDVRPLSTANSRALVGEILQKLDRLPDDLRDMIVNNAEGNPFYVEELIKMFIEDGVIVRGQDRWQVELERLKKARVPPTLTNVLQARLDSLSLAEKELLQRASVVGRLFWDAVVADLRADSSAALEIKSALDSVQARELVFQRDRSAFDGTHEYIFKHALLRDVTYETVLLKLRRVYHREVAEWLETHSGERLNEYASLIADHYDKAGEAARAVAWLRRAAEAAVVTSAYREALAAFERALALVPPDQKAERAVLLVRTGYMLEKLCDYPAATARLEAGLALARDAEVNDAKTASAALREMRWLAVLQGRTDEARQLAEQALAWARQSEDAASIASASMAMADYKPDTPSALACYQESLALFKQAGDARGAAVCLLNMGNVAFADLDYAAATRYYHESLALYRQRGDRWGIANCLANLGTIADRQGDDAAAIDLYEQGLALSEEIGDREGVIICRNNLGHTMLRLGDELRARGYFLQALSEATSLGLTPLALDALTGLSHLRLRAGRAACAAELLGLVVAHPALHADSRYTAEMVLDQLRAALPLAELEAALERGKALDFEAVVKEILEVEQ